MSLNCDGKRCGKCFPNSEVCNCLINWPNDLDRNREKFYYEDDNEEEDLINRGEIK